MPRIAACFIILFRTMNNKHIDLKTDRDVFLDYIASSPEFTSIKSKIPSDVFIGLDRLMGRIQDPDSTTGKELLARANEASQKLEIKPSIALDLLLGNYGLHKTPKVRFCQHSQNVNTATQDSNVPQINSYQDALDTAGSVLDDKTIDYSSKPQKADFIHLEIYANTTRQDIDNIWSHIKEFQKNYLVGNTRADKSQYPELAYCIYRQRVLANRKLTDIFDDYLQDKLEGYHHISKVIDYSDFRKYYANIVKGILIGN